MKELLRKELIKKASILRDYLKEALDSIGMDAKDGEYDYFPKDFGKLKTSLIDCYIEAYRVFIPNFLEANGYVENSLMESFKYSFSHEVSFTTDSKEAKDHALKG